MQSTMLHISMLLVTLPTRYPPALSWSCVAFPSKTDLV